LTYSASAIYPINTVLQYLQEKENKGTTK